MIKYDAGNFDDIFCKDRKIIYYLLDCAKGWLKN